MDSISRQDPAVVPSAMLRRAVMVPLLVAVYAAIALPAMSGSISVALGGISLVLAVALIALSIIDIEDYRLPDVLTIPLVAGGLLLCAVFGWGSMSSRIFAAVAGFAALYVVDLIYHRVRGRAGLGLGDAKLLAAAGAWLGAAALPAVVLVASLTALVAVAIVAVRGGRISRTTMLPFGPFLAFGFWIVWVYSGLETGLEAGL